MTVSDSRHANTHLECNFPTSEKASRVRKIHLRRLQVLAASKKSFNEKQTCIEMRKRRSRGEQ